MIRGQDCCDIICVNVNELLLKLFTLLKLKCALMLDSHFFNKMSLMYLLNKIHNKFYFFSHFLHFLKLKFQQYVSEPNFNYKLTNNCLFNLTKSSVLA